MEHTVLLFYSDVKYICMPEEILHNLPYYTSGHPMPRPTAALCCLRLSPTPSTLQAHTGSSGMWYHLPNHNNSLFRLWHVLRRLFCILLYFVPFITMSLLAFQPVAALSDA